MKQKTLFDLWKALSSRNSQGKLSSRQKKAPVDRLVGVANLNVLAGRGASTGVPPGVSGVAGGTRGWSPRVVDDEQTETEERERCGPPLPKLPLARRRRRCRRTRRSRTSSGVTGSSTSNTSSSKESSSSSMRRHSGALVRRGDATPPLLPIGRSSFCASLARHHQQWRGDLPEAALSGAAASITTVLRFLSHWHYCDAALPDTAARRTLPSSTPWPVGRRRRRRQAHAPAPSAALCPLTTCHGRFWHQQRLPPIRAAPGLRR